MKSCFFIGHREATEELIPQLTNIITELIADGITEFVVGSYGGFDRVAASALRKTKATHPNIILTLLTPYHPADRPIALPRDFDGSFYPPGMEAVPRRLAILQANRYMAENCDVLVAYAWHPASNAKELVDFARKKSHARIISIARVS